MRQRQRHRGSAAEQLRVPRHRTARDSVSAGARMCAERARQRAARALHGSPRTRHQGAGGGAGDALRPFLLHAFGGLYLDVDVECFEAVDASLGGFDIVLQLEDGGNKSLNNAVMAGVPGHELWAKMQGLLHERRARAPARSLASRHAGRADKRAHAHHAPARLWMRPCLCHMHAS